MYRTWTKNFAQYRKSIIHRCISYGIAKRLPMDVPKKPNATALISPVVWSDIALHCVKHSVLRNNGPKKRHIPGCVKSLSYKTREEDPGVVNTTWLASKTEPFENDDIELEDISTHISMYALSPLMSNITETETKSLSKVSKKRFTIPLPQLNTPTDSASSCFSQCEDEIFPVFPVKLPLGEQVTEVSCGFGHWIARTKTQHIYTFGLNSYGQLGIAGGGLNLLQIQGYNQGANTSVGFSSVGPHCINSRFPCGIDKVISVATGPKQSFAVVVPELDAGSRGVIYAWGENAFGQLGLGCTQRRSLKNVDEPTEVVFDAFSSATGQKPEDKDQPAWEAPSIVRIRPGFNFCLALSTEGQLFGWGINKTGQLGLGTTQDFDYPQRISLKASAQLDKEPLIRDMSCGIWHSLVVTESDELYQLGISQSLACTYTHLPPLKNIHRRSTQQPGTAPIWKSVDPATSWEHFDVQECSEDFSENSSPSMHTGNVRKEPFASVTGASRVPGIPALPNHKIVQVAAGVFLNAVVEASADSQITRACLWSEHCDNMLELRKEDLLKYGALQSPQNLSQYPNLCLYGYWWTGEDPASTAIWSRAVLFPPPTLWINHAAINDDKLEKPLTDSLPDLQIVVAHSMVFLVTRNF